MEIAAGTLIALAVLGVVAGCLGAVVGIGGGIVLVPALVLLFHFDMHEAVATSLVAVVGTSTAAGSVYVGAGLANMRLGMTLEIATAIGGITGGLLATSMSPRLLASAFAVMMLVTAILTLRGRPSERRVSGPSPAPHVDDDGRHGPRGWEERGTLAGGYFESDHGNVIPYRAVRLPFGSAVALLAGTLSGMLGVGGGFLKVPAMNLGMRVPLRVAAATSNFMIGVTAVSSLYVYFARGFVRPFATAPVVLGVIGGSLLGTAVGGAVPARGLRAILATVLGGVAVEMGLRACGVSFGR